MGEQILNLIRYLATVGTVGFLGFQALAHSDIRDINLTVNTEGTLEFSASFGEYENIENQQ